MFKNELTLSESGFLFDHSTGLTYSLNTTGQFIFRKLEAGQYATDLLNDIQDEFAIDEMTARKDLDDFLRQLKEMGIID